MEANPVVLARAYAGITQTELAARIGRTQPFVSRLELGDYEIAPLAGDLARATGLPLSFFNPGFKWHSPESAISFRKRSTCPASVRNRADFYAHLAHNRLAPLIADHVAYPEPNIPTVPMEPPKSIESARRAGAEAARSVREAWGVGWGPIGDVFRLIEAKGVRLFFVREKVEHLDGFATWTADVPYIFLNQGDDPARMRLDVAHELGHLVMHRDMALDAKTDMFEAMAFGFATEFLAPWFTFGAETPPIPDLVRLGKLRARWRMSMQAIVKHMYHNGAINDAAYSHAFRKFGMLGFRRGPEPGWIVPDSSAIHAKFIEVAEQKGLSPANLAEAAGIPQRLLGDLVPETTWVKDRTTLL